MLERNLSSELIEALGDSPGVFLQGPRQAGKTTLVKALSAGPRPARYITLDDAATLAAAKQDPQEFIRNLRGPVVIDEVQRVEELALAIKASIDQDRTPGRFLLTGSASIAVLPHLGEYLAGRIEILTLWPFTQGELERHRDCFIWNILAAEFTPLQSDPSIGKNTIVDRILRGGFPVAVQRASQKRRDAWFGSYITTILQRDVRDLANIEGLSEMPRLLALLATRAGSLINFADLSRSLSMPQTTLKRYMTLLQAAFLVQPLPAWSSNLGKRLVKSSKITLVDTGLLTHLLGMERTRLLNDPTLLGHVFENFIAMELRKQIGWSEPRAKLFHFRTSAGEEVDILIELADGRVIGIETKATSSVSSQDFRGLRYLQGLLGQRFLRGIILYLGTESLAFGDSLFAMPASALWTPDTPQDDSSAS